MLYMLPARESLSSHLNHQIDCHGIYDFVQVTFILLNSGPKAQEQWYKQLKYAKDRPRIEVKVKK